MVFITPSSLSIKSNSDNTTRNGALSVCETFCLVLTTCRVEWVVNRGDSDDQQSGVINIRSVRNVRSMLGKMIGVG